MALQTKPAKKQEPKTGDRDLFEGDAPETEVYSSALPPERDPETAWQAYAEQAINGLYPHLRAGVDYAVGRSSIDGDIELLFTDDTKYTPIDWAKVEESARILADADPYLDYAPGEPLATMEDSGRDSGERHADQRYDERPGQSRHAKAVDEGRFHGDVGPHDREAREEAEEERHRRGAGSGGEPPRRRADDENDHRNHKREPQKGPPPDPYFDKDGKRIKDAPK